MATVYNVLLFTALPDNIFAQFRQQIICKYTVVFDFCLIRSRHLVESRRLLMTTHGGMHLTKPLKACEFLMFVI